MGLVQYTRQLLVLLCLYILVIPNECYFLFIINQLHNLNILGNLDACAKIKPNTPEYFLQHDGEIYNTNELNALYNTTPQSLTTETAQEFFKNRDGNGTTQFQKPQAQDIADACTDVGHCDSSAKYRTYNGACNNLRFKNWGLSGAALVRLVPAYYEDGKSKPRLSTDRKPLPNPRLIHKTIFKQKLQNDAVNTYGLLIWGQMVAHDTARIIFQNTSSDSPCTCCTKNSRRIPPWKEPNSCYPIDIDKKDNVFSKYGQTCMYFVRSTSTNNLSCTITPQQLITLVSHYIDMSILYGSNERDANNLRTFKKGLLKSRDLRGREYMPQTCKTNCHRSNVCYMAGDPRVNDVIILSVVHLVFLRHHNKIVRKLAVLNPSWTDEKLYQYARRIVIAMVQHITYNNFLPIILGDKYVRDNKLNSNGKLVTNEYSQTTNAGTLVSFTSCAWRIFHSLIPDNVNFYSEDRKVKLAIPLSVLYHKPQPLESQKGLDGLIRSLCSQPSLKVSKGFTPQVTDKLFRGDEKTGGDLIATDIQRSRDHGVARYVDLRVACGFKKANSFNDLLDMMTLEDITKLKQIYSHVNDIDCMVGCMLEKPLQGSMVGPTLQCIIGEQFKRWKNGDRFFYTFGNQSGSFTQEQLTEISKSSLSYVLCLNGNNIQFMQKNSFQQVSKSNPLVKCSDIPKMSFMPWKEKNNK